MFPMEESSVLAHQRYLIERRKDVWRAVVVGGAIAFGVGTVFLCIALFFDVNGPATFLVGLYSAILIFGFATMIAGGVGYSTLARGLGVSKAKPFKARPAPAPVVVKEPAVAKDKAGPADKPVKAKMGLIPAWLRNSRISQLAASLKSRLKKKAGKKPSEAVALAGSEPTAHYDLGSVSADAKPAVITSEGKAVTGVAKAAAGVGVEDLDSEIADRAQAMGKGKRLSNKPRPASGDGELKLVEPVQTAEGDEKK